MNCSQQLENSGIARHSDSLDQMNELSLWKHAGKREAYRILWLRSFDPPMVFRMTINTDGTAELITKRGGYEPAAPPSKEISRDDSGIVLDALTQVNFWHLPNNEPYLCGLDGADWIIEGVKDGKYHVVERWGGGELKDWALLLMEMSGEDLQPIY